MDKPSRPGGSNASQPSGEADFTSERDLGASAVFAKVRPSEPPEGFGATPEPGPGVFRTAEIEKPRPAMGTKTLAEPVVHKVVVGQSDAESSTELLDRLRLASLERGPVPAKRPISEAAGNNTLAETDNMNAPAGGGALTQLFRTFESELPATPARKAYEAENRDSDQDSGFTSLLRKLGAPASASTPAQPSMKTKEVSVSSLTEGPGKTTVDSGNSGFTDLPAAVSADASEKSDILGKPSEGGEPGAGQEARRGSKTSGANAPGEFTKLIGTFGGAGAGLSSPVSSDRPAVDPSYASADSFTRMLALEQDSASATPVFHEAPAPQAERANLAVNSGTFTQPASNWDPFARPSLANPASVPGPPTGNDVGITRLIQMLDQPSNAQVPGVGVVPGNSQTGAESSGLTRKFGQGSTPEGPFEPESRAPRWNQPPAQRAPEASGGQGGRLNAPVAPGIRATGPSDVTKIIDASRVREEAMKRAAGTANPTPAAAPPQSAPGGGVPQMPGYPPPQPQIPGYPMFHAPQAGAMPGGSMPQAPGVHFPTPPIPAPPAAPPAAAAAPGVAKLQQYVPVLLVVIIVLLVAILVTVVFLMKH